MDKEKETRVRIEEHGSAGLFWLAAWLFTIGYLDLNFWRGVFALLLWPYYIGVELSQIPPQ